MCNLNKMRAHVDQGSQMHKLYFHKSIKSAKSAPPDQSACLHHRSHFYSQTLSTRLTCRFFYIMMSHGHGFSENKIEWSSNEKWLNVDQRADKSDNNLMWQNFVCFAVTSLLPLMNALSTGCFRITTAYPAANDSF